jgi:hypothetical protein
MLAPSPWSKLLEPLVSGWQKSSPKSELLAEALGQLERGLHAELEAWIADRAEAELLRRGIWGIPARALLPTLLTDDLGWAPGDLDSPVRNQLIRALIGEILTPSRLEGLIERFASPPNPGRSVETLAFLYLRQGISDLHRSADPIGAGLYDCMDQVCKRLASEGFLIGGDGRKLPAKLARRDESEAPPKDATSCAGFIELSGGLDHLTTCAKRILNPSDGDRSRRPNAYGSKSVEELARSVQDAALTGHLPVVTGSLITELRKLLPGRLKGAVKDAELTLQGLATMDGAADKHIEPFALALGRLDERGVLPSDLEVLAALLRDLKRGTPPKEAWGSVMPIKLRERLQALLREVIEEGAESEA